MRNILALLLLCSVATPLRADDKPLERKTENVIFVTTDGLRAEEVFNGAEELLLTKENGGVADVEGARKVYWDDSPAKRREAILPFFWKTIAHEGQVFGEKGRGSIAVVTNRRNFSYPGYSEMLVGFADDRIDSNAKKINPNGNVLEWLATRGDFKGRVAVYSSWDVLPHIVRAPVNGLATNAGWEEIKDTRLSDREVGLNRLIREGPRRWPDCRDDAVTFPAALEYLKKHKPKVFYICLGDTDEHAHAGRYDLYLDSARAFDRSVERLWKTIEDMPEYRGKTTLILSTDHGRGSGEQGWRNHGANVPGADSWWVGVLGPDTPALGTRSNAPKVVQAQIAATLAALLGEDYNAHAPKAARPLPRAAAR